MSIERVIHNHEEAIKAVSNSGNIESYETQVIALFKTYDRLYSDREVPMKNKQMILTKMMESYDKYTVMLSSDALEDVNYIASKYMMVNHR